MRPKPKPDDENENAPPEHPSSGQPIPPPLLHQMEVRLHADFSDVRIHSGHNVAALGALAYTQGNHIHFPPDPNSVRHPDPAIMAHELSHILQQRAPGQLPLARRTFEPVP